MLDQPHNVYTVNIRKLENKAFKNRPLQPLWSSQEQTMRCLSIQCNLCNLMHFSITNVTCLKHPSWTDTLQCLSLPDSLNYLLHFLQKITPSWTDTSWCLSVLDSLNYLSHFTQKMTSSWTDTSWCLSLPASWNHLLHFSQLKCILEGSLKRWIHFKLHNLVK